MNYPITIISHPITIISSPITIISYPITIVSDPITIISSYLTSSFYLYQTGDHFSRVTVTFTVTCQSSKHIPSIKCTFQDIKENEEKWCCPTG